VDIRKKWKISWLTLVSLLLRRAQLPMNIYKEVSQVPFEPLNRAEIASAGRAILSKDLIPMLEYLELIRIIHYCPSIIIWSVIYPT